MDRNAVSTTCFSEFATTAVISVARVKNRHTMIIADVTDFPCLRGQQKTAIEMSVPSSAFAISAASRGPAW